MRLATHECELHLRQLAGAAPSEKLKAQTALKDFHLISLGVVKHPSIGAVLGLRDSI